MRIAICDDDNNVVNQIEDYLSKQKIKDLEWEVFQSGDELAEYAKVNNVTFQIYFMDIEMAGHNGIETAAMVRDTDKKALIIFMTQHKDYVYGVFEVLPFRFLVKPLDEKSLGAVFNDALAHLRTVKQIFTFKQDRATMQVYLDEIMYFESVGRKMTMLTSENNYVFYGKLYEIYEQLDKTLFVQIHASYIVNMEYISVIKDTEVTMKNGISLPISKRLRADVREQHLGYIEWRCGR